MSAPSGESSGSRPNVPRLCDAHGRRIRVIIPSGTKAGLTLFGLCAIAATGFLGYSPTSGDPIYSVDGPFRYPWLLFAFFCALALTLVNLVFRGKEFTAQRRLGSAVIVASAGMDVVLYFYKKGTLGQVLSWLGSVIAELGTLLNFSFLHSPAFYVILNYLIFVGLVVDVVARWIRHLRRDNQPANQAAPQRAPTTGPLGITAEKIDEVQELAAGDFVVRGVVILIMGVLMANTVRDIVNESVPTACTPVGTCAIAPLAFLDLLVGLISLAVGFVFLGVNAQSRALGKRQAEADAEEEQDKTAPGWGQIGKDTAHAVTDPLASSVRESIIWLVRFIRINLRPTLHFLAWAAPMFIGIGASGGVALIVLSNLHSGHSSIDSAGLPGLVTVLINASTTVLSNGTAGMGSSLVPLAKLVGFAALFVMGVVLSLTILARDRTVAIDVLNFLRLIGFVFLILFCVYGLALAVIGGAIWLFVGCWGSLSANAYCPSGRAVEFSIGPLTILSFVLLMVFTVMNSFQRRSSQTVAR